MLYSTNYKMKEPISTEYYDVKDFNYNTDIIDNLLYELSDGSSMLANEHTVTLTTSGWDANNTQTVRVDGVLSTSIVIPGIAMNCPKEQFERLIDARISIVELGSNSIKVKAYGNVPDIDCLYSFVTVLSYANDSTEETNNG